LAVTGDITATGDLTAVNLNVATDIIHVGDTDTKITFGANTQTYTCGASERFKMDSTGVGLMGATPIAGLAVTGDIDASGDLTAVDIDASGDLTAVDIDASGDLTAVNLNVATDIIHVGDTDTKITFGANTQTYTCAGGERFKMDSTGVGLMGATPIAGLAITGDLTVSADIDIATGQYLRVNGIAVASDSGNKVLLGSQAAVKTLGLQTAVGEALSITTTGRVGIGNTAPSSVLELDHDDCWINLTDADATDGDSTAAGIQMYQSNGTTRTGFLGFSSTSNSNFLIYNDTATGSIGLYTNAGAGLVVNSDQSLNVIGALSSSAEHGLIGTNSGRTIIQNTGGGYIEVKSGNATYGLIIRDYNSDNWGNISTNDGYLELGYRTATGPLYIADNDMVGIGDSTPTYPLDVNGNIRTTGYVYQEMLSWGVNLGYYTQYYVAGNALYQITSTRKVKGNIKTYDELGLPEVLKLRTVSYIHKTNPSTWPEDMPLPPTGGIGFIAEEAYDVHPKFTTMGPDYDYDENGQRKKEEYINEDGKTEKRYVLLSDELVPDATDDRSFIIALVNSVKELKAENDSLLARVEALENKG